jgi:hypothetical protein
MATDSFQERRDRLARLQAAVNQYVDNEQKRINQEVSVLTAIRDGRKAGASGASAAIQRAAIAAQVDLAWFLKGT